MPLLNEEIQAPENRVPLFRRGTVRYHCAPATVGKVYADLDEMIHNAWILDLSEDGVGIATTRPLPINTTVTVRIRDASLRRVIDLSGRTKHCNLQPDQQWYVGIELRNPLTPEQLNELLD